MGRGKHITPAQRFNINRLRNEGMTLSAMAKRLKISVNACHQALKYVNEPKNFETKVRAPRPRKTTPHVDHLMHRLSEKDRFKTAVDIRSEITQQTGVQ